MPTPLVVQRSPSPTTLTFAAAGTAANDITNYDHSLPFSFLPLSFCSIHDHHIHHHSYIKNKELAIISEHEYVGPLSPPAPCDTVHNIDPDDTDRTAIVSVKPFPRTYAPPFRFQKPLPLPLNVTLPTKLEPAASKPSLSARRMPPSPLMATLTYGHGLDHGAPGSPPDLTNSKSSKSSSFHSSTLEDVMGPNDLSHFEEINLDDADREAPGAVSKTRSVSQHAPAHHSFRDLTGSTKSRFPTLKSQVNGAVRQTQAQSPSHSQLGAPGRSMRRGFSSPSAPSLATGSPSPSPSSLGLAAPGRRSRSPSPSQPRTLSSRRSSHNLQVAGSTTSHSPSINGRRQSWQYSARKTVKELEAECDVDDDDEVPEEYMMPNVPISPRPVSERSPTPSLYSPPSGSPSPATSRPASLRSASPALAQSRFPMSPVNEMGAGVGIGITGIGRAGSLPPLTRQRTNTSTWEDTYAALDEDARKVTEALEEFQTEKEREQEIKRQLPNQSRKSSVEDKDRSKDAKKPASLPPLRKSDPLIDPFQPSAEKEKHLSRTRPSWLPPKDPKEEQKHLKEYAKIQARVQEAMREQARKEEAEKLARERASERKAELWSSDLLPKYATLVATPAGKQTYRQLWWTGIPPKVRGSVWKTAVGNELEISETTFNVALSKARDEVKELGENALGGCYLEIVDRTRAVFPELKMFGPATETGPEQPLHKDLLDVCLAYHKYRPDIAVSSPSSSQSLTSIHHIAGVLLLNMDTPSTFACLCNVLNRPLPLSFLICDAGAMHKAYTITLSTLAKKAPQVAKRLEELRVEPREYLDSMFGSLFCDRLPVEHAARLMDVYVVEGDKIATRAAVGMLVARENGVLRVGAPAQERKDAESERDEIVKVLTEVGTEAKMHPDDFMHCVYEAGKNDAPAPAQLEGKQ